MYGQPAKKLLFMGGELGQWNEWYHETSVDWHLLKHPMHDGIKQWITDLNRLYRSEPALHELDHEPEGFEWIDCTDAEASVVSFIRKGKSTADPLLAVFNFTPVPRHNYRVGVPRGGHWKEVLNSDAVHYGGSGQGNIGGVDVSIVGSHGHAHSLNLVLPPLAAVFFKSGQEG
jgi:1,4-alpha-glucan branching enzyme